MSQTPATRAPPPTRPTLRPTADPSTEYRPPATYIRCVYIYIYDTYTYMASMSAQSDASWLAFDLSVRPSVRLPLAGGARQRGLRFEF
jgi:hypothetical protein